MKKREKYNLKQCFGLVVVVLIAGWLLACEDNDQWVPGDIPGKGGTATYSNKLSAPVGGNTLALVYSGEELIGKDVDLAVGEDGKAILTLKGILPGELETSLTAIALIPADDGYVFQGNATGKIGTTLKYKGKIEKKKLTLEFSEVILPTNGLTGNWYILPNNGDDTDSTKYTDGKFYSWYTCCNTIYSKVGEFTSEDGDALWDPEAIPSLVPLAFQLALQPVLSCMLGTVLHDVTFREDGNVTAVYAAMPDTIGFMQMMGGKGIVRNEEDWETSPRNLATYYPVNDTTICVLPNVDMIIRQIEKDKSAQTKAGGSLGMIEDVLDIYALLNKWSTTGIKLNIKKNNPENYVLTGETEYRKYLGDYVVYIDKSEIEALYALLDIAKVFIPEDMLDVPMDELLLANGIDVEQAIKDALGALGDIFAPILMPVIHKFTINNILTQIKTDLDEDPLQLGIWLNEVQVPVE